MAFARRIAEQLARPSGMAGRLLGTAMDVANRKPVRLAADLLAPRPSEHILDAGCGTGAAMVELLRRAPCRVTGIDPSDAMLQSCRRRLRRLGRGSKAELLSARIEDMPFADESFDAVLALNVLYFCDAEGTMLKRLARVLRPGGRLVAYVTHRDTMTNWPFAREGIHRLFDQAELSQLFESAGFAPESIQVHERPIARSVMGLLVHAQC